MQWAVLLGYLAGSCDSLLHGTSLLRQIVAPILWSVWLA